MHLSSPTPANTTNDTPTTAGNELDVLRLQITQLEQRHRRHTRLLVLALLVLTAGLWQGASTHRPLVAVGHARLIDGAGQLRMAAVTKTSGSAELALYDLKGTKRTVLALDDNGCPRLSMHGSDGARRIEIDLVSHDLPSITFFDAADLRRLSLTTVPPALICTDGNGKIKAVLGVSKEGKGAFLLEDAQGRPLTYEAR